MVGPGRARWAHLVFLLICGIYRRHDIQNMGTSAINRTHKWTVTTILLFIYMSPLVPKSRITVYCNLHTWWVPFFLRSHYELTIVIDPRAGKGF